MASTVLSLLLKNVIKGSTLELLEMHVVLLLKISCIAKPTHKHCEGFVENQKADICGSSHPREIST